MKSKKNRKNNEEQSHDTKITLGVAAVFTLSGRKMQQYNITSKYGSKTSQNQAPHITIILCTEAMLICYTIQ